jgi:hypothetical protein
MHRTWALAVIALMALRMVTVVEMMMVLEPFGIKTLQWKIHHL